MLAKLLETEEQIRNSIGNRFRQLLLALIMTPAIASASNESLFDLSLEELQNITVSTASKIPRSLAQSAGIVSVYSADEMALFGGRDLSEILAKITGLMPINDTGAGRYRMTMRGDLPGISNNHILILLNGIPLNRESYAGGLWVQSVLTAIPLDIIKQVEIVRGPGSVLYGTNAFAGVINLITYEAADLKSRMQLAAGSDDSVGANLALAGQSDDSEVVAALRYYDTDGIELAANDLNKEYRRSIGMRSPGAMLTARSGNFHTNIWWGLADDDAIRGSAFNLQDGRVRNEKYFFDVGYANAYSAQWTVKLDVSHVVGRTHLEDPTVPFGEIDYETDDSRMELQVLGTLTDNLSLVMGTTVDYLSVHIPPPQQILDAWDNTLYGAYAQAEYVIGDTRFIGGAQFNKSESTNDKTVPRFGIIHNFTAQIGAKLMYAEAFRAPYGLELETQVTTSTIELRGNPNLDNESVTSWDAQLFYNSADFQSALTYFRSRQEDLIIRTPISAGPPTLISFVNLGELKIEGVELETRYIPSRSWYLTASATWQHNMDGHGIEDFTLNPDYVVKAGIGYQNPTWSAGLFDIYQSAFKDNIIITPNRIELNPASEAHHFLTFNATYKIAALQDLELGLYIDNVLDEVNHIPTAPGFTTSTINTLPSLDSGRSFLLRATLPLN